MGESQYHHAVKSSLFFSIDTVTRGRVEGQLMFFPCLDGRYTRPSSKSQFPKLVPMTDEVGEVDEDDDSNIDKRLEADIEPLFECYFQGVLILHTTVDVLPFCELVGDTASLRKCLKGKLFFNSKFEIEPQKLRMKENVTNLLRDRRNKVRIYDPNEQAQKYKENLSNANNINLQESPTPAKTLFRKWLK